jgi:hypothetical protein
VKQVIYLKPDGSTKAIVSTTSRLQYRGKKRMSRVEPVSPVLRLIFLFLRSLCNERSRAAAWTRTWACRWQVKFVSSGNIIGPFESRAAAIAAEIEQLEREIDEQIESRRGDCGCQIG